MLQEIAGERVMIAPQRREAARYLKGYDPMRVRRVCRLVGVSGAAFYYRPHRDEQLALRTRIQDLATSRVRYRFKRVHVLLAREGKHVNKKRVDRLYCLEGLQLHSRRPRRHVSASRRAPPKRRATAPDVAWSMNFVSDQTRTGVRFRALTVPDVFARECLAAYPGRHLGAADVVDELRRISASHGAPRRVYCDKTALRTPGGPLGVHESYRAGVLPPRKTHGQCVY